MYYTDTQLEAHHISTTRAREEDRVTPNQEMTTLKGNIWFPVPEFTPTTDARGPLQVIVNDFNETIVIIIIHLIKN